MVYLDRDIRHLFFCRWCGATIRVANHVCPDGHVEDRFVTVFNPAPPAEEELAFYDCGHTQTVRKGTIIKGGYGVRHCPHGDPTYIQRVQAYSPRFTPPATIKEIVSRLETQHS